MTGRAHGSRQDARSRVDRGARPRSCGRRRASTEFDPDAPGEIFSVDTPPPYVSAVAPARRPRDVVRAGRVHRPLPAHARPQRLLPDGLRRQRPARPSATSSRSTSINKARTTRSEFRALCLEETARVAVGYERFWRKLGLSVDWRLRYSTIDDHCRRTAQLSFLDLYREGPRLPLRGAGVLGPVDADVARAGRPRDDHAQLDAARHRVPRARRPRPRDLDDAARADPELRRAVLQPRGRAVRSRSPAGTRSCRSPATRCRSSPTKTCSTDFGTGLMMVCTFGDGADVQRWKRDGLDLRLGIDPAGKLTDVAGAYAGLDVDTRAQAHRRRPRSGRRAARFAEDRAAGVGVGAHAAPGRVPDAAALVRPRPRPHRRAARAQRASSSGTPTT